jgi:hypothetical protein
LSEISITVNYGRKKKKEYEISIVPNRFNVDYFEYVKKFKAVLDLNEKLKAAESEDELKKIQADMVGLGLDEILNQKYNLIKTIMIANEYEYDVDFWDLKVEPSEVDKFIVACAIKDKSPDQKKKISQMLLLTTNF